MRRSTFYLISYLDHAAQDFITGSKGYSMEGERTPAAGNQIYDKDVAEQPNKPERDSSTAKVSYDFVCH